MRFDQDRIQNSDRIPYAEACRRKYGDEEAWRTATAVRLAGWGFNTLGSWSDDRVAAQATRPLAVTPNLHLAMSFAWRKNEAARDGRKHEFPDVFDPALERHVVRVASELCAGRSGDPRIIGWFADNELRWDPDWRGPEELLTLFLNMAPGSPGREGAIEFLRTRYGEFAACSAVWRLPARSWDELAAIDQVVQPYFRPPPYDRAAAGEEVANRAQPGRMAVMDDCDRFLGQVATRYFELTSAAIRKVDQNHLLLGCRFAYPPARAVIAAAGRYVDVISFNCYDRDPAAALDAYAATGKPCLIGEFSFRGDDSGLPNTRGAGPRVATQAERAAGFRSYVATALRYPSCVGYHWFEYADQPAEGRFDGENSNFGMVTIDDRVYGTLVDAMAAINGEAELLHAAAAQA
ncbi:MAG: agarase [Alphaproteobacteria bacterium]